MFSKIKNLLEKQSLKEKIFLNTFVRPSIFLSYSTFVSIPNKIKKETNEYREIALNQAEFIINIANTIVKSNFNTLKQHSKFFKSLINEKNPFLSKEAPIKFSSIVETAVATIFKREEDNFIRVATSIKTEDGLLALNTYLEKDHPARQKLLNGQSYLGRAYMFGKDYMTYYEPIIKNGYVIGAYFVGLNINEELKQLKDFLKSVKIGDKGYIYAVDLMKDLIVVHPIDEGYRVSELRNIRNLSFYDEMLKRKRGIIEYMWPNERSKDRKHKEKVAIFEIVKDLNWLISLSYYKEDIEKKAKTNASDLQNSLIMTGLLNISLIFLSATQTLNQVTKTIKNITEQIRNLKTGRIDLGKTLKVETKDEIGELSKEFNSLLEQIRDIQTFREKIKDFRSFKEAFNFTCNLLKNRFDIEECLFYSFFNDGTYSKYCANKHIPQSNKCPSLLSNRILTSSKSRCPHFSDSSKQFICIPINLDKDNGYVIQIVKSESFENEGRLLQYLEEALPLLQTKKQLELLKEQSLKDELTGIYNRRFLHSTIEFILEQTKRHQKSLGVLMCDIDYFKRINDTYGHDIGDLVLQNIAKVIKSCLRKADLIIRYGGEEFLVLLTDINTINTVKVAEKIRESVKNNMLKFNKINTPLTISIGIAIYPDNSDDFNEVVKMADKALYKAKNGGRNKVEQFIQHI